MQRHPPSGNISHASPIGVYYSMIPDGDVPGSSQAIPLMPKEVATMEIFSDGSADEDEGEDLISLKDVTDAADLAVDRFEEELIISHVATPHSWKRKELIFSDESSETEYSSSSESSIVAAQGK